MEYILMEDSFTIGPFSTRVGMRDINIKRDKGVLVLLPATHQNAVDLVIDTMRIEGFKPKPDYLSRDPFVLKINGTNLEIREKDQLTIGIKFSFEEGDSLIYCLKAAFDKWIDISKANPSVGSKPQELGDTPFDGR